MIFINRMAGLGAWGLKIFYATTSDRTTFKLANLAVFTTGALNCLWIVYDLQERNGLSEYRQFIAWISLSKWRANKFDCSTLCYFNITNLSFVVFTVVSFILPTTSPNSFRDRLMAIISSLALPFSLMSLSYEPLFYMTFTSNIYYWVSMIYTDQKQMYTVRIYKICGKVSNLSERSRFFLIYFN